MDPITIGLLAVGGVSLALWFATTSSQRKSDTTTKLRRIQRMVPADDGESSRRLPVPTTPNLPTKIVRDLPSQLNEAWLEGRVTENIELFRGSNSLFEKFLLQLRDRYQSRWEIQILENVERRFKAETAAMEAAARRRTIADRSATEVIAARIERDRTQREADLFQAEEPYVRERVVKSAQAEAINADSQLMEAQLRNEQLRRKLSDTPKTKMSDEDAAYERGRRQKRTQQAEQKGAFDQDFEHRERMRQEFEERKREIEADSTRTPDEKTAAIKRLRTEYAKVFGREY